jgi:hypothetical protein
MQSYDPNNPPASGGAMSGDLGERAAAAFRERAAQAKAERDEMKRITGIDQPLPPAEEPVMVDAFCTKCGFIGKAEKKRGMIMHRRPNGTDCTYTAYESLPPQQSSSATAEAIDAAAPNTAPDPAQVWRDSLNRLMAEYGQMDRARRKAFLVGLGFATSSVQLAACNLARMGNPNAADAFRHLAATISGAALALDVIPTAKNARRKAKRR